MRTFHSYFLLFDITNFKAYDDGPDTQKSGKFGDAHSENLEKFVFLKLVSP